jgi:hypothetical protein
MSIEKEIDSLIQNTGGKYRDWYVGLALNPRHELFTVHHVNEKSGTWVFKDAGNEMSAREIEAIFLKRGCKGGPARKDSSRHVYVYKI